MGSDSSGSPFRDPGEVPQDDPDDWPARLERLKQRKSRRNDNPLSWAPKAARIAPISRRRAGPLLPSVFNRLNGQLTEANGVVFTVECTHARGEQSESGRTLSIQWRQSAPLNDDTIDNELRSRLDEIKRVHAQCVARLYAVVHGMQAYGDLGVPDLTRSMKELNHLLAIGGADVAVSEYGGFARRLADNMSLLNTLVAHLENWNDEASSARILALARHCLGALGWCDPVQGDRFEATDDPARGKKRRR